MKLGLAILLTVVSGCIGALVGVTLLAPSGPDASTRKARDRLARLERENSRLRASNPEVSEERREQEETADALEASLAEATRKLEDLRGEAAEEAAEDVVASPAEAPRPVFFADRYDGALRRVDWKVVGTNMKEMTTLIPEIIAAIEKGESPSPEQTGRVQQLNGPLVTAALKLQEDLPGVGVNGKFSDPSFMLNAMAVTLETAEMPLGESQSTALEETARTWMARDLQRREAYDDRTWELQRLYEEAELKDGFFREAFGLLETRQAELLSPPHLRGRTRVDLFSSSLIYATRIRPLLFESREDVVEQILRGASMTFRLSDEERPAAKAVIENWLDTVPHELLEHEANVLDRHGMVRTEHASRWARLEHALLQQLSRDLGFEDTRVQTAQDYPAVLVPMRRPADSED